MGPEILTPAQQELIEILRSQYASPGSRFAEIVELIYHQPQTERVPLVYSLVRWHRVIPLHPNRFRTDPFPFSDSEYTKAKDHLNLMFRIGMIQMPAEDTFGTTAEEIAATVMSRLDMLAIHGRCVQIIWLGNALLANPSLPVRDDVHLIMESDEEVEKAFQTLYDNPSLMVELESLIQADGITTHEVAAWVVRLPQRTHDANLITVFTQRAMLKVFEMARQHRQVIFAALSPNSMVADDDPLPDEPIDPKKAN
jgi:hypothetical protein